MLESMIESPMPTRAEVTDVANAVFEEADAIMLSGETTVGKYPVKCIEVFDRIATRIERSGSAQFHDSAELTTAAGKTGQKRRGHGQRIESGGDSRIHPARPHGALCRVDASTLFAGLCAVRQREIYANELTLNWGVTSFVIEFDFIDPQNTIENALKNLTEQGRLK